MNYKTILAVALSTAFLAACGGGGGGDSAPAASALSATQTNFEATAIKDTHVGFDWNLPTTNVAPTNGTHYFYTTKISAAASPSTGSQTVTRVMTNLASSLALPTLSTRGVSRVLKSGVIYATNATSKGAYSYAGNDVVATTYATDGLTALYSSVYDTWSAPIALTGPIGNTTILKSFLGFSKMTTQTVNFDFTQSWLAGSTYFTRKGYRQTDTLFVYDWTGTTYDANVTAYAGTETTIENYFNSPSILAAGGMTLGGVVYAISDGVISSVDGTRAWVASSKRPTSAAPTDNYLVLFQLNGKIYYGGLIKAGTRLKYLDGVDATIVNDYDIHLNGTAGVSIKQAVKF